MRSDRSDGAGFRVSRRRAVAIGGAAAASVLAGGVPIPGGIGRRADSAPREGDPESIDRIHDAGITGDGVGVAVLDPTGFDPTHADLTGTVEEIRQFGPERAIVDGTSHGTAAAASVTRLAPSVSLSLASFRRTDEFLEAIDWARRRSADVILTPVAAHGTVATPRSDVFRAARRAVEAGCTFVAPTGNAALGHWQGPYGTLSPGGSGGHRRLRIRGRSGSDDDTVAGRFVAWLVVGPTIEIDLTLALLRSVDDGERWNLVSLSQPTASRIGQRLTADLADGEYALVVRPASPTEGPTNGGAGREVEPTGRVEVTTPTHTLSSPRPLGSIAVPASVPGVVGVGGISAPGGTDEGPRADASDGPTTGEVSPHSGRGPTASGAVGVDVVAPPVPWVGAGDPGTSAAASRTAGAAALVLDAASGLAPRDVAGILRASAGDTGRRGRDLAAGSGRLDVVAAVQRARAR
ncbi:S8 family serine peptidase [Halobellus limi]|uniref:Subtilase family protein n=1 Tax=Halobellus limi TaxID=699433 RepID=A0A1H6B9I1_9EURY|nr:S8 family serine peptidase [Halobellus limi]QCC49187.1 hypothetical protein DV707_15655 [Halobellus limi]SEG56867.1 Subtilase family protein [Halobellus limi]